ncbi:MAG: tryptophan synthase subunit beta [Firmicutes bacterium]|nr:tryptophan synthase subunit beta [Bacillota bacterium]
MPQADATGHFGPYGGRYVPETLMPAVLALEAAYREAAADPAFWGELEELGRTYVGRPTPLTEARRLTAFTGGARIFLKREDLCHTGAHKVNNTLGQVLLARRMGKRRVLAETGAGQHGVATATAAALFGLECTVYMGAEDIARQALNVYRMRLLGARVVAVESGSGTLKDATNEALRAWTADPDAFYVIGSVVGPHPYPTMVRDFQSVIGREVRTQALAATGRLPDLLVAAVGGGSNAAGLFSPFEGDDGVRMLGVEAAGEGVESGRHAASLSAGEPGVLHGALSYLLQTPDGQVRVAHSISAGLDYPGVGPEHAYWRDSGRVTYTVVRDDEALEAVAWLCRLEGILPALESAHAVYAAVRAARDMAPDETIVVSLSGRGDKDVETLRARGLGQQGGER